MSEDEVGPQPTPETETPEKFPGGADNLADPEKYGDRGPMADGPAPRDLDPTKNPAVGNASAGEVGQLEDKQQESGEGAEDQEVGVTESPSAGQTDEEGDPEEPA